MHATTATTATTCHCSATERTIMLCIWHCAMAAKAQDVPRRALKIRHFGKAWQDAFTSIETDMSTGQVFFWFLAGRKVDKL